jgi:hypothetical protein
MAITRIHMVLNIFNFLVMEDIHLKAIHDLSLPV